MPERHHCGRHNLIHDGEYCPKCLGNYSDPTHNVLNRMREAFASGHGVRISADELRALSVTFIGQIWEESDPRILTTTPVDGN